MGVNILQYDLFPCPYLINIYLLFINSLNRFLIIGEVSLKNLRGLIENSGGGLIAETSTELQLELL